MTVSLINLSNGDVSLEFAPSDLARVRSAIDTRFGRMRRRWFTLAAQVTFGGQPFAFQNEWDDPCLISLTPEGAAMLRSLAADFGD